MPSAETVTARSVMFGGVTPVLRVKDIDASLDFYIRVLGFNKDWGAGGFVSVSRGKCSIFLSQGDQGHPGSWIWIGLDDAEAMYKECKRTGAKVRHPPTNYPWALEMQIEDPDGNVLRLGSEPKQNEPIGEWLDMDGIRWKPEAEGRWKKIT